MSETKSTIYIASDHGGFELKNYLTSELKSQGYAVEDMGPFTWDPEDDYPDFAAKVTRALSSSLNQAVGILICRNGVGVSMFANKVSGIRCALSWDPQHTASARKDDNINILALPADYIDKEQALKICVTFLATPFSNEERHIRRLGKYDSSGNI